MSNDGPSHDDDQTDLFRYPPSPLEIKMWISELRDIFVAQVAAITTLHRARWRGYEFMIEWDPSFDIGFPRRDGSENVVSALASISTYVALTRTEPDKYSVNIAYTALTKSITLELAYAIDQLKLGKLAQGRPLLQFMRHLRNAIAHGGRFTLMGDEPKYPARFRGFEITKDVQGFAIEKVLFIGDILDLLDDLELEMDSLASAAAG